jgi:hypothetical protein
MSGHILELKSFYVIVLCNSRVIKLKGIQKQYRKYQNQNCCSYNANFKLIRHTKENKIPCGTEIPCRGTYYKRLDVRRSYYHRKRIKPGKCLVGKQGSFTAIEKSF